MKGSLLRSGPEVTIAVIVGLVLLALLLFLTPSPAPQPPARTPDKPAEPMETPRAHPEPQPLNNAADFCTLRSEDPWFAVTEDFCHTEVKEIQFVNDEGQIITVQARVADESFERFAGYQSIGPGVIGETLILFVFEDGITGQFHMRNVYAPLDIAFIQSDGKIINTQTMMPGPELYGPGGQSFRYALEARMGFFQVHKISATNSRLVLSSLRNVSVRPLSQKRCCT